LKIAATVVGVICTIFVLIITIQPREAHLQRIIIIEAPDSVIFPYLSNYRILSTWWPWPKMEAELKQRYEGIDGAVGSKVIWSGENTGNGNMVLEELHPFTRVKNLMTISGQKQTATNEFLLEPDSLGTKVTWTYNGINDGILGKAKWLIMGSLLNSQYDLGLKNLKQIIEEKQGNSSQ